MEAPTIYKAHFSGLCKGIYPTKYDLIWYIYSISILGSWNGHWSFRFPMLFPGMVLNLCLATGLLVNPIRNAILGNPHRWVNKQTGVVLQPQSCRIVFQVATSGGKVGCQNLVSWCGSEKCYTCHGCLSPNKCQIDNYWFLHISSHLRRSIIETKTTMWGPPLIGWFIMVYKPHYIVICVSQTFTNHRYWHWIYFHQLSYRLEAPHCIGLCHFKQNVSKGNHVSSMVLVFVRPCSDLLVFVAIHWWKTSHLLQSLG